MIIKDIINKLKECDDFHNRCDCLLEHDEITYLLEYIEELQERIDEAIEYLESYNVDFVRCEFGEAPISIRELDELLKILKGV